jgi:hypothetical protein
MGRTGLELWRLKIIFEARDYLDRTAHQRYRKTE